MTTPKFIFVVGGVMSSVGKGVSTSSIALILQSRGYTVTVMKADPYINVDAGTMNPTEHGEVFVTEDGDETDQDIGNYERFINTNITSINYMTTGRVYQTVIQKERNLEYQGKCVEVVPHIPEEIIRRISAAQQKSKADVTVIEIGGTVGEYQNILFLEAARMLKNQHPNDVAFVLVSYLPVPSTLGEMKTKPTQHAVRLMNEAGLQPDFIIARAERMLDDVRCEKLAQFCSVPKDAVIPAPDAPHIYDVPLQFEKRGFTDNILKRLNMRAKKVGKKAHTNDLLAFKKLLHTINTTKKTIRIGVVGKYFHTGQFVLADSYISVIEALKHAAWSFAYKPELVWLDPESYEKDSKNLRELAQFDGVLIPGGFGSRGVEGKIAAIQYVREHKIPYFGLCYGMQLAAIEVARHVASIRDAHTQEIDPKTKHPVIIVNPFQKENIMQKRFGGTMRLGSYDCALVKGTKTSKAYGKAVISERHRHRYEFNNAYRTILEEAGMRVSGTNPETDLVEIMELNNHPWFVGTQFHPEFLSRPLSPHPLFKGFIAASIDRQKKR
ncbi:MAG: CTP synthase [Candidatus Kerfeldbacteria bacterium]|nr:CTP synthase [Candidatus Kerfeldbacteria bacterium]